MLEYPGFRVLCPTRWTVRAESMKNILNNWVALEQVWDESLDVNLEPQIKGRIIDVKNQMNIFNYFYGVAILQLVLIQSDNLSKTLQKTLEFELLWQKMVQQAEVLEITQPCLPRKRKRPATLLNENRVSLDDEFLMYRHFTETFILTL